MPLQYIVGVWSFREIRYRAVRPVFIPRFETEQLLTILSKNIGDLQPLKFLDLCCGSGVIGISLAK
jgi:release factor glutamine methyltransferase